MFDEPVLGVDPGTAAVGLAVVARNGGSPRVAWATTFRTPRGLGPADRLRLIHDAIREAIRERRPAVVAMERLMWGRNVDSAMAVARASGAIMVAAAESGLPVEEYAPLEVKMAVTGVGNAAKEQVRLALARLLGVDGVPSEPDAADAVAVAVCHLQQSRLRRMTREAVR
jgi:crossover junction endodeoxyribonuclease RuvC